MDFHKILADKIKNNENIALYCYGILASHMLSFLQKFYHVVPTVVIDNDERKRGSAEFGIPVMSFAEAKETYEGLQYFICSDDFKYTIIGDLLEKGVKPEAIINYVPVEKRRTCLYFYNRLLLTFGVGGNGTQFVGHCNKDSFKTQILTTEIPLENGNYERLQPILDDVFTDFEQNHIELCNNCPMNKEQYMVSQEYEKHYKSIAFYQETCADCLSHCVYCCVGGNTKNNQKILLNFVENNRDFLNRILNLNRVDDDFTCAIDMSERDLDKKIKMAVEGLTANHLCPLVYKINSCLLVYSEALAQLMRQGMAYIVWSLDAGTRETYRAIKQIDAFEKVIKNVKQYISQDVFSGKFIVAKYLIVKGMNDNSTEFDAFLNIVTDLGLKFVSLSFDFNVIAEETDIQFIQNCYKKLLENNLQLTYVNNSEPVARALSINSILHQ